MSVRVIFLILSSVIYANGVGAQGFAGLGQSADGYALPAPDYVFTFPDDHGAHNDYRIEWWYLTCLLYTSPSPRDLSTSRMPSSA